MVGDLEVFETRAAFVMTQGPISTAQNLNFQNLSKDNPKLCTAQIVDSRSRQWKTILNYGYVWKPRKLRYTVDAFTKHLSRPQLPAIAIQVLYHTSGNLEFK
jgi:hypothetical protein